jgi:hypothetical protein
MEIKSAFSHFITRSGDRLMEGDQEFRFISWNIPELIMNEEPYWHIPDLWEQEDAIKSILQMGGRVTRSYVLSVRKPSDPPEVKRHVNAPGVFDEDVFKALDKTLELCNRYGVRLIIPLVDQWHWEGGISEYAVFRGKEWIDEHQYRGTKGNSFWTDLQIREDFKRTIDYIVNRTNTCTGEKYRDDKAILAWETGNELFSPGDWVEDIAAHIKIIDPNHLVLDGYFGVCDESLHNPDIDIVSNHYSGNNYARRCREDRERSRGKKPMLIGEFGIAPTHEFVELLEEVVQDGTAGALIWSLRQHDKAGGFYHHNEYEVDGILYRAYHWPGFPEGGKHDEINVVRVLRAKAFEIQGIPEPSVEIPEPPVLLPIQNGRHINWRGSTGAGGYDVERAENREGPWSTIGSNISDSREVYDTQPLFRDDCAESGKVYYYRIKARNCAGVSDASNIVGPA